MLFNSNVFIFLFLPLTLLVYHLLRRFGWPTTCFWWLFVASVAFYGYWEPRFLLVLGGSMLGNFALGQLIVGTRSRGYLIFGIATNLVLLGVFKYLGFFSQTISSLVDHDLTVAALALPLGISFFTFTQIAFLVDAYRGRVAHLRFVNYGLFVTFFPHLIAGPIVHHAELMPQFDKPLPDRQLWRLTAVGLALFTFGLIKKVVIADSLAAAASPMFDSAAMGAAPNFFTAWSGTLAYTLQIYFDFSGYSDMAVGLGLMFGVRLPMNFNSPYKARSIIDFWRRWHITLSRFLRDYLYFALGGNRRGKLRRYVNLMLVMLIGGLWHGAGWTFLLWGALHGLYLVINHAWQHIVGRRTGVAYGLAAQALTLLAVAVAWVLFRASSLDAAASIYTAMFGFDGISLPLEFAPVVEFLGLPGIAFFAENYRMEFYTGLGWIVGAGAIALLLPNSIEVLAHYRPACNMEVLEGRAIRMPHIGRSLTSVANVRFAVAVGALLFLSVKTMNSARVTEFLYFNF
jgi:D-alanyl-lipoteichoic acid acyltransferase DltB (MBOAT superfamily)